MELLLIRHGLPERAEGLAGPADPPLSSLGWEQARAVADYLKGEEVDGIIAGPSRRARETAMPLAGATGLDVVVDDELAEYDVGATSYVPPEQLRAAGDPRWEAIARGEFHTPEVDPVAFRARIVARIEDIVAANPGRTLAVFTNAGIVCGYTGHILGQTPTKPLWFAPAYASITRVGAARDGRRGVISLNETGHVCELLG